MERWTVILKKQGNKAIKPLLGSSSLGRPKIFSKLGISEHLINVKFYEMEYQIFNKHLDQKLLILGDIYMYCFLNRLEGFKVKERREVLRYLIDIGHDKNQNPLSLYIDIGQEKLLFQEGLKGLDSDIFNLNRPVEHNDLICFKTDRNHKIFIRSKLILSELLHLTKGQVLIVYSILTNEIGLLLSLVQYIRENSSGLYFSFGIYRSILHFAIAIGRVAHSNFLLYYLFYSSYNNNYNNNEDSIELIQIAIHSNSYYLFINVMNTIMLRIIDSNNIYPINPISFINIITLSTSHRIRYWYIELHYKYQFCEILNIIDENALTQKQLIIFMHYIGFEEYIKDKCTTDYVSNHYDIYNSIKNVILEIQGEEIIYDINETDDNDVRYRKRNAQRIQQLYYHNRLYEDDYFHFLYNININDIIASIIVKCLYKQWPDLINYIIQLLEIFHVSNTNNNNNLHHEYHHEYHYEYHHLLNYIYDNIINKKIELKWPCIILKSTLDIIETNEKHNNEKKNKIILEMRHDLDILEITCSIFIDLFISLASISELQQNINKQKEYLKKLKVILSLSYDNNDDDMDNPNPNPTDEKNYYFYKNLINKNGKFPEEKYIPFMFKYNDEDVCAFTYAIENGSLSLLEFLFDNIGIRSTQSFESLINHTIKVRQFDILHYILITLQKYIQQGIIEPINIILTGEKGAIIECDEYIRSTLKSSLAHWFNDSLGRECKFSKDDINGDYLLLVREALHFGAVKKVFYHLLLLVSSL